MTIVLIIVLVLVVGALFVVKAKQSKENAAPTTSSKKTTAKGAKKATPATKAPEPEAPAKPKINLESLLGKLDVLIADKEFAKAEGLINSSLNQDRDLHDLYFRLLKIYQLQHDDFAIKQLMETVQNLNLNTVYQELYNEHEIYKEEQEHLKKAEQINKTADIIESSSTDIDAPVEQKAEPETQNNSQAFDSLAFDFTPASTPTIEPKEESSATPTTLEFEANTIEHSPNVENTLEFSFTAAEEKTPAAEPTLEFQLDTPAQVEEHSSPELSFSLENLATLEPATDTPVVEFQLDEAGITAEPETSARHVDEPAPIVEQPDASTSFADPADPIVQAFPQLTELNPVDLDIDLAEQYIRFGEFAAAKELLIEQHAALSAEQATKVEQLLQKIAS